MCLFTSALLLDKALKIPMYSWMYLPLTHCDPNVRGNLREKAFDFLRYEMFSEVILLLEMRGGGIG